MDSKYLRILHEYEIADASNQHFASIVYIREVNHNNSNATLCDGVDATMESIIMANCNVQNHCQPKMITTDAEVEELNKRLRVEYQLKAYFTFFSEVGSGKNMEYSRVTIHVTILVKKESDVHYFDNIGFSKQVTYPEVEAFTFYHYAPSPVFTLQEHPLVHGIVCYKEATKANLIYMLYRYNDNLDESVMAIGDLDGDKVEFLQGINPKEKTELLSLCQAFYSQNDYAPLYRIQYSKGLGYCAPTRIVLNKERDKFTKAQRIVMQELQKGNNGIKYSSDMNTYLKMMNEA